MTLRPSLILCLVAAPALSGGFEAAPTPEVSPALDIRGAHVEIDGRHAHFHADLNGKAGDTGIVPAGSLAGAPVHAYVWPLSADPGTVGFEPGSGTLALAATSHPDFDDTPLFDETADGRSDNDGAVWHSHWVVLAPSEACGDGSLAVRDIAEGESPAMPLTWPGLPLFLDSPGYAVTLTETAVMVNVPAVPGFDGAGFDAVTSALSVNANLHAPLLCVTEVFDIASGDLSLPGRITVAE